MIFINNNNLKEDEEFYYFYDVHYEEINSINQSIATIRFIFENPSYKIYSSLMNLCKNNPYLLSTTVWQAKIPKCDLFKITHLTQFDAKITCIYKKISKETIKKLMMLL